MSDKHPTNEIKLSGTIVREDPTLETTKNGSYLCKVSLSTSNGKDKATDEWRDSTYHNLVAFGEVAQTLSTFKKGNRLCIVGKQDHNKYTDKEGKTQYFAQVIVWEIKEGDVHNVVLDQSLPDDLDKCPF